MTPDLQSLQEAIAHDGRRLDVDEASALFAALLAGEVAPHEGSAFSAAWRRRASLAETTGYMRALDAHAGRLEIPRDRPRPVLLASYHGTERQPNLTALVALLLKRYGVSVLVHGHAGTAPAGSNGDARAAAPGATDLRRVATSDVLWELGIEPAANLADAQARLLHDHIAYVPAHALAPGLARLLALPGLDPLASRASSLAQLLDPFGGDGYRVIGAAPADDFESIREFLIAGRRDALLFRSAEGEPFPDPRRLPRLEHIAAGVATVCVDAESEGSTGEPSLPAASDAGATAAWIANVLAGTQPVPQSIVAQLGCCLAGARRLGAAA